MTSNLANCLKANKIDLNAGYTKLLLFTSPKEKPDCDLKIKLNGKMLCETDSVIYLCTQIDENLTWKKQINHVAVKLNKLNAILPKLTIDTCTKYKNSEISLLCNIRVPFMLCFSFLGAKH